jgi:cyclohexadienyl dehydratase
MRSIATRGLGWLALVLLGGFPLGGDATSGEESVELRVGTSGDYAPFSLFQEGGVPAGLDVALAEAFAREHGWRITFVPFRWPALTDDLAAGRFDLAWSGVTVRPERSLVGAYAVPTLASGAIVLVDAGGPLVAAEDLQRPGLRFAVNAGGHLERVARRVLPAATIVALPDNALVPLALSEGTVDAAMTDTLEAPHWNRRHGGDGWRAIGPLTRDLKAPLVASGRQDVRRQLDTWLLAAERDGRLAALRSEWLDGASSPATARPQTALVAAIAERLALMPDVARAKRRTSSPLRVLEREMVVLASAVNSAHEAARRAELPLQEDAAIAGFFGTLIEAAVAVQEAENAASSDEAPAGPELDVIRAALIRIGDRIALLLPYLPPRVDAQEVERDLEALVDLPGIDSAMRRRIAAAVVALAEAPRKEP